MTRFGTLYPDGSIAIVACNGKTEEQQLEECRQVVGGSSESKIVVVELRIVEEGIA
jgi:hypothetical protein